MKRIGNLYQTICSMENLKLAHKNARKGKGWYSDVKKVNAHEEDYLKALQEQMVQHTYRTSEYETFIRREGEEGTDDLQIALFPGSGVPMGNHSGD